MTMTQSLLGFCIIDPGVWRADWAWGVPLIVLTVVFHVLGLGYMNQSAVKLFRHEMNPRHPMRLFVVVISTVTLFATCMHAVETGIWAASYQHLGALPNFKAAMLYSLGAMTTFGHAGVYLEDRWQLLGAIEALSGWLLFGLTGAFLFGLIQECRKIVEQDPRSRFNTGKQV